MKKRKRTKTSLQDMKDRIKKILDEIRIVLPGTLALLGFLLSSTFSNGFPSLSLEVRYLHLTSLIVITLATIFLMAPVAYDRIIKLNKELEHFHSFTSTMILLGMILLGIGLSLELFVVTLKVTNNNFLSLILSGSIYLLSVFLWFGYTLHRKHK